MYRKEHHRWVYDDFSHEQSLVFRTQKGLVIFNSCCHGGVANIINEVGATFPTEKVYGIIGGFHLFNKSEEEIKKCNTANKRYWYSLCLHGTLHQRPCI